ncbi:MAG TPA: hypothetical protein VD962_05920 [Rubricoccaceae bacterium]|nr:hypothetical protein [Rubricoccaceae bacterium]
MPSARSVLTTLPSRTILVVGGMSLLSLTLLVALTFEAAGEVEAPPDLSAPSVAEAAPALDSALLEGAIPEADPALFPTEPAEIPSEALTALEQAADSSALVEMQHFLRVVNTGFGGRSVQIAPGLHGYAFRLAGRLNVRPGTFLIRVSARDGGLAEARAETLRRLFRRAGVRDGALRISSAAGPPGIEATSA